MGYLLVLPVPGPGFVKLMRTDQNLVPNCPAQGPATLGPEFGPPTLALQPNPAQNRPQKPRPGTVSTIEQPKVIKITTRRLKNGRLPNIFGADEEDAEFAPGL